MPKRSKPVASKQDNRQERSVIPSSERPSIKGRGSMKGMLILRSDIDLTKPIYQQVFDGNGRLRPVRRKVSSKAA